MLAATGRHNVLNAMAALIVAQGRGIPAAEIAKALDWSVGAMPANDTLYVLPTYTAMLAFRKLLHGKGWVQNQFWEQ